MSNKTKRRILSLSILLIMISILSYGTYAYFTGYGIATNTITTGYVDIEIVEYAENEEGELEPFEDVFGVLPGMDISKIPCIRNVGAYTTWVRVRVVQDIKLNPKLGIEGEADPSVVSYNFNTDYWTYVEEEDYWYYKDPVNAYDVTEPLFTLVTFDKDMGNLYQNSIVTVTIEAQATQHVHNGNNVFEALGWKDIFEF